MAGWFAKLGNGLVVLALLAVAGTARAEGGKELFEKQCAGCHSIGGGDGGGPDLKGVGARRPAAWIVRIITEPEKLTAEKDATQAELVKKFGMEMPNLGVSRDDAQKIASFLGAGSGGGAPAAGAPAAAPAAGDAKGAEPPKEVVVTKELLATGVQLFTGKQPFAKGGAPCVSCHRLGYPGIDGGVLAADLTSSYEKMGENGIHGVLKGLSFPVMKKIYADRPLTDDEIAALTALFKDASAKKAPTRDPYPAAGLGFFALLFVAAIIFKRRIR
ncbi:cytochrome c [Geomonas sp. Red32]|uniref:c-type cytochrome n=1 Tax=Geomonas sp. Red32 TaxID=2912856 RepID=UPI00202CC0C8|nr:cytochrome c [Geomonas sp. Red32]MCM0082950.1 cytochrome c [Geomonas sp. Red32]